jgi:hypothetical protein
MFSNYINEIIRKKVSVLRNRVGRNRGLKPTAKINKSLCDKDTNFCSSHL